MKCTEGRRLQFCDESAGDFIGKSRQRRCPVKDEAHNCNDDARRVRIPKLQTDQMLRSGEADVVGISPRRVAYDDIEFCPASELRACQEREAKLVAALEKIAKPSGITTDGSGSAEEFEELYDFWHMNSVDKLNIAADALAASTGTGCKP